MFLGSFGGLACRQPPPANPFSKPLKKGQKKEGQDQIGKPPPPRLKAPRLAALEQELLLTKWGLGAVRAAGGGGCKSGKIWPKCLVRFVPKTVHWHIWFCGVLLAFSAQKQGFLT